MKKTIAIQTCEITGETTIKWIENQKCIHKVNVSSQRCVNNVIRKYRTTGTLPGQKIKPIKFTPIIETTETILRPVNYQYFHKRVKKPVYVSNTESVMWNGKTEIILILKDAAGKVYRILKSLVERYLTEYKLQTS